MVDDWRHVGRNLLVTASLNLYLILLHPRYIYLLHELRSSQNLGKYILLSTVELLTWTASYTACICRVFYYPYQGHLFLRPSRQGSFEVSPPQLLKAHVKGIDKVMKRFGRGACRRSSASQTRCNKNWLIKWTQNDLDEVRVEEQAPHGGGRLKHFFCSKRVRRELCRAIWMRRWVEEKARFGCKENWLRPKKVPLLLKKRAWRGGEFLQGLMSDIEWYGFGFAGLSKRLLFGSREICFVKVI